MMIKRNLESIQLLRAVAVLMVVFFHYRFDATAIIDNSKTIFFNGSIGVDLFFVISGFIIYHVTDNAKTGFGESISFIVKRLIRVSPPYFLMSFLVVYFGTGNFNSLVNSYLFVPSSNSPSPFYGYPSLVVGWSLNYEIYFYLASAIGICFLKKHKWAIVSSIMLLLIIPTALLNGNISLSSHANYGFDSAYFSMITNSIILDFILGVVCAYLVKKDNNITDRFVVSLSILSIVFFFTVYIGVFRSEHGPILWGLSSFMIVYSFVELEKREILYFPKSLVFIGNISFSVYLVHIPALLLSYYLFNNIYPLFNVQHKELYIFLCALAMTSIGSVLYYYLIERFLCEILRKSIFSALYLLNPTRL